jgi:hypothetical protein
MPAIPAVWRKWLYAVGIALVPVLVAFGWVDDNVAPAILGLLYAVFMGGLAVANVTADPMEGDEFEDSGE